MSRDPVPFGPQLRTAGFRGVFSVALLALGCSLSVRAQGQEANASDRATARALAGDGFAALKKKDYEKAEDCFRRADALVHAPTLVVDLARSLAGLGRVADAYQAYESVIEEQQPANAPWVWTKAVADAKQESSALGPSLAWLTITVKGPTDATLTLDGKPLPPNVLGVSRPVDPGEREIAVNAAGFISKQTQIVLRAGTEMTLELELLPEPKPEAVVVGAPAPVVPRTPDTDRKIARDNTLAYVSFGVAGVGLATGAVAGILWLSTRHRIVSACGGLTCDQISGDAERSRLEEDQRSYDTLGTISGAGFAVGLAGAAAGTAFLLFKPKSDSAQAKAPVLTPYWAATSLGVRGSF